MNPYNLDTEIIMQENKGTLFAGKVYREKVLSGAYDALAGCNIRNETIKREIDVIIQKDGRVVPIEVKSGNTWANSLKTVINHNKDIDYGYKFIDGNIGTGEDRIITLPLYMIAFI